MKKSVLLLTSLITGGFLFCQTQKSLIVKFRSELKPDKQLVKTQQKFNISNIDLLNTDNGMASIQLTGNKKLASAYVINLISDRSIEDLIEMYKETDLFEFVESNYTAQGHGSILETIPDDTFFNRQWSHVNDGTFPLSNATVDADIDSDLAWDLTQGDSNLVVAILDTGLKLDHPEFSGRIWVNPNEIIDGIDNDGNGYIDDVYGGWDFAYDDNLPTDSHGHGTNVTGIALASGNNNSGYAGMNWHSKIMVCKVLDNGNSGAYSWITDAIYYAVDNGAAVINISAGGDGSSFLLENAVNYAYDHNVAVVVSTGNQNSVIQYPARYSGTFAIGSTDSDDTRSVPFFWNSTSGSNFGPELDFVAPGNYIYGLSYTANTNFNTYWGGTSQAAPHVTGLISLLLSMEPNLTVEEIRTILKQSSEDQVGDLQDTNGWDQYYGFGRVNAYNALLNLILSDRTQTHNGSESKVVLYPNPLSNNSSLKISNINNGKYDLKIYDHQGQLLDNNEIEVKHFKATVPMPDLNPGIYLIRIKNLSGSYTVVRKLIIE